MTQLALCEGAPELEDSNPSEGRATNQWTGGQVLRLAGGAMLVASFSTFLLRRWELYSDFFRYGVMLSHTVLLVAAALFCGFGIRENRGARTFLVLTLAAVPFNMSVLAALVYSRHAWDSGSIAKPTTFLWVASSEVQLLAILCVALPTLIAATWFAFRTLARTQSQGLLWVFTATNLLLLVPVRSPLFTALVCVSASVVLATIDLQSFGETAALRTKEGRFARALLLLPLVLMLGRTAFLYPNFLLVFGAAWTLVGTWFAVISRRTKGSIQRSALVIMSTLSTLLGWLCIETDISSAVGLGEQWQPAMLLLPWAGMLHLTAQVTGVGCSKLRALAAIAVVVATVPTLYCHPSIATELFCAAVGILWLLLGTTWRSILYIVAGSLSLASALIYQLLVKIRVELLSHWLFLSLSGIGLILLASYVERHQLLLRQRVGGLIAKARSLDY